MSGFVTGLELSRRFYQEAVLPALEGVAHSAARLGPGSEVLGFDTTRSTDHDWGARLQLFLAPDEVARNGERIARQLPEVFLGYPTLVEIADIDGWMTGMLGFTPSAGVTTVDWLAAPTQRLAEITAGAVFHDGLGRLEEDRERLAWYPRDVWLYVLGCQWKRISQEEAFVGRCGEVGDELGSAVVAARLVRDLMRLVLLMERRYPPYSKWLGSAFGHRELTPHLAGTLAATDWRTREEHLARAYEQVADLHNGLGLTETIDPTVRLYFDRPFRVIGADRFAGALFAGIADPEVRALPPVGAVDQFGDSTDFLGGIEFTRGAVRATTGGL
ncbi:DUF4037 domain-containing protein [Catenulispora subtropica]|uniref:DUF4037 domain-containing protein n=1 Tax=Catenulispora subtropica TaxID=450798 RepID=A0ABP5CPS7_9ACTN